MISQELDEYLWNLEEKAQKLLAEGICMPWVKEIIRIYLCNQTIGIVYKTQDGKKGATFIKRRIFWRSLFIFLRIKGREAFKIEGFQLKEEYCRIITNGTRETVSHPQLTDYLTQHNRALVEQLMVVPESNGVRVVDFAQETHYLIGKVACECEDVREHHRICKHRIAAEVWLFQRGWASLKDYLNGERMEHFWSPSITAIAPQDGVAVAS